jgi:hypothetical protein
MSFYYRKGLLSLAVVALAALAMTAPTDALAQHKSPGGVTGIDRLRPGSSANHRGSRSLRHALDYSRDIYQSSQSGMTMQPSVAKSDSEELGRNIARAQQELAVVRQEVGSDPATAETLKTIDQHLAVADKEQTMLYAECCKDSVDGLACMKHCNQIIMELDKAQAEHDALMRAMEIKEQALN